MGLTNKFVDNVPSWLTETDTSRKSAFVEGVDDVNRILDLKLCFLAKLSQNEMKCLKVSSSPFHTMKTSSMNLSHIAGWRPVSFSYSLSRLSSNFPMNKLA